MYHQVLGVVNIKIDVTFRLFNLDKYQAITLHREVAGVTYAPHPEKNGLVGTVCLDQDLGNSRRLKYFLCSPANTSTRLRYSNNCHI